VDLGDRGLDLLQDPLDHLAATGLHIGHRGDGLDPVRRGRRHLAALLVVLLDAGDFVEKLPLQRRVTLQVAPHDGAEAFELALDPLPDFMAPVRQQHRLVAFLHLVRRGDQPARTQPQRAADQGAERPEQLVHGLARGIEENQRHDCEDEDRERGVVGPEHPGLHRHGFLLLQGSVEQERHALETNSRASGNKSRLLRRAGNFWRYFLATSRRYCAMWRIASCGRPIFSHRSARL
jgi:hypothetical protein